MRSQGQHQASVCVTMCREKWSSVHTRCKTVNACFTGHPKIEHSWQVSRLHLRMLALLRWSWLRWVPKIMMSQMFPSDNFHKQNQWECNTFHGHWLLNIWPLQHQPLARTSTTDSWRWWKVSISMAMSICMRMLVWLEQPTQAQCTNYDCCAILQFVVCYLDMCLWNTNIAPAFPQAPRWWLRCPRLPMMTTSCWMSQWARLHGRNTPSQARYSLKLRFHYLCRTDSWHPHASPLTPWSTQSPMMMALVPGLVMRWIHQT